MCIFSYFNLYAQDISPVTINVSTAGTLPTLISSTDKYSITDLTLTGNLNGTDIKFLRDMAGRNYKDSITPGKLTILNLENANIVKGGEFFIYISEYDYYDYTKDNSISSSMFRYLTNLVSITLPKSINYIGSYAFKGCTRITSIIIPEGVITINAGAFSGCIKLSQITIPQSVTTIGNSAFYQCFELTNITLPPNITSISDNTFQECKKLATLEIPGGVTSLARGVFYDCTSLTSVAIPSTVTSIGNSTFYNCPMLTNVKIPDNITSINNYLFSGCRSLTSVTIPKNVTTIGNYSFNGCSSLSEIYEKASNPPVINSTSFTGVNKTTCKVYVPEGSYLTYQQSIGWKDFGYILEEATYYTVNTSSNEGGSVAASSSSVKKGAPVTFTITSNQGYSLTSATLNGIDVLSGISNNNYTITSVNENISFTVNFSPIPQYNLSATYGLGGKVTANDSAIISNNKISFIKNSLVTLHFIPDEGYSLSSVTLNGYNITDSISDNYYIIKNISEDTYLNITFTELPVYLKIEQASSGSIKQIIKRGSTFTCIIEPSDGWKINTVIFNGEDVTTQLDSLNQYTTPAIMASSTLNISFESITLTKSNALKSLNLTNISNNSSSIKVYAEQNTIIVTGVDSGDQILIYSVSGLLLHNIKATSQNISINVDSRQIYLIKIKNRTYKLSL